MNQIELESTLVLVWSSEWSFKFKRRVSDELLKMLDELE